MDHLIVNIHVETRIQGQAGRRRGVMRLAGLAACLWSAWFLWAVPAARAGGVVSLNLCADQLLVLLAPERVAALEPLARDPALSFVASQARALPSVRADAEAVLRLHPDLVLAGRYGAQTTVALLQARGLQVEKLGEPQDFSAIAAQVTHLAAVARRAGAGRGAGGWYAGAAGGAADGQTWHPRCSGKQAAGAPGLAALPMPCCASRVGAMAARAAAWRVERILANPPDLLVTETASAMPSMATDLAWHPALRGLARRSVDPALLICGGPFTVAAAEALAK